MQYRAEPTAATLQQNLDKATQDKHQNFLDSVFVWSSCFVFWFYSSSDLKISSLTL